MQILVGYIKLMIFQLNLNRANDFFFKIRKYVSLEFHLVFGIDEVSLSKTSFKVLQLFSWKNKNFTNLFAKVYSRVKVNKSYVKVNFINLVNFQWTFQITDVI